MAQGYIDGGPEVGDKMMGDFDKTAQDLASAMDPFLKEQLEEMDTMINDIVASVSGLIKGVVVVCLVAILIAIITILLGCAFIFLFAFFVIGSIKSATFKN